MYCSNCNKSFSDEYSFCDTCGGKLEQENSTGAFQPVTPQPTATVAPSQQEYQPTPTYQTPPVYAPQTPQDAVANDKQSKTVSFGAWMGILFLNIIPFMFGVIFNILIIIGTLKSLNNINPVNIAFFTFSLIYIILLFVWTFGTPKARSLKNYAKATLLMTIIVVILVIISFFVLREKVMELIPQIDNFNFDMNF